MSKHTPGSWYAKQVRMAARCDRYEIRTVNERGLGHLLALCVLDADENAYNARLIAEAPAMLELVRWMANYANVPDGPIPQWHTEACAILARVEAK